MIIFMRLEKYVQDAKHRTANIELIVQMGTAVKIVLETAGKVSHNLT